MKDEGKNGLKTDPVCRMAVREEKAVTADCEGVVYYFCSEGCRDKFLRERTCARTAYDLIIIGGGNSALQIVENLHTVARNIHLGADRGCAGGGPGGLPDKFAYLYWV